ncbi:MAG: hypothetical protein ACREP8_16665 [Candidatus Binatia bacterium]
MARKITSGICMIILAIGLLVTPSPVGAQQSGGEDGAYVLGSVIFTLLHVPFKLLTCGTGQVISTLGYVGTYGVPGNFEGGTNGKEMGEIARRSCTGDWVISPSQVKEDYQ